MFDDQWIYSLEDYVILRYLTYFQLTYFKHFLSDDLQSTDEENEPDLTKMTESERKEYLEKKAKRKAEREEKRKERYGEKYEEMKEKHKL